MGICQLLFGDASLKHVIIHLKMKEAGKKNHSVNVSVLSGVMNANGTYVVSPEEILISLRWDSPIGSMLKCI